MEALKQILAEAKAANALRVPIYVGTLEDELKAHGDAFGMLTAFRHAANSLAVEAGVIASHVEHSEAEKSIIGDVYFLQLIAEAELRLKSLSIRYEQLRAATIPVLDSFEGMQTWLNEQGENVPDEVREMTATLKQVLKNDLS